MSPAQSAEREVSEAEAAKTETDAIRCAAEGRLNELAGADEETMHAEGKAKETGMRTGNR